MPNDDSTSLDIDDAQKSLMSADYSSEGNQDASAVSGGDDQDELEMNSTVLQQNNQQDGSGSFGQVPGDNEQLRATSTNQDSNVDASEPATRSNEYIQAQQSSQQGSPRGDDQEPGENLALNTFTGSQNASAPGSRQGSRPASTGRQSSRPPSGQPSRAQLPASTSYGASLTAQQSAGRTSYGGLAPQGSDLGSAAATSARPASSSSPVLPPPTTSNSRPSSVLSQHEASQRTWSAGQGSQSAAPLSAAQSRQASRPTSGSAHAQQQQAADSSAASSAPEGSQQPQSQQQEGQQEGQPGQGPSSAPPDAEPPAPRGPRYQEPTLVLPKGPLQDYRNADAEHLSLVFSKGGMLNRGIRSLPNAMSPDFRSKLYDELLAAGRRETEERQASGPRGSPSYSLQGGPQATPLAFGQRRVVPQHPYAGSFTTYEYMPSEFERQKLIVRFERLKNKLAQVVPSDFVVKATPSAPKGAPAFSEYNYTADPYQNPDAAQRGDAAAAKAFMLNGPFMAGGRVDTANSMRGLADDCMMALCRHLSKDWPSAFLQVFEDRSGAVVLSFDKVRATSEGDLPAYMANMVKHGALVAEYKLVKDGAQWGLVDSETQSVFYVMWPPWVRHRYVGAYPAGMQPASRSPGQHSSDEGEGEPEAPEAGPGYTLTSVASVNSGGPQSRSSTLRRGALLPDFGEPMSPIPPLSTRPSAQRYGGMEVAG